MATHYIPIRRLINLLTVFGIVFTIPGPRERIQCSEHTLVYTDDPRTAYSLLEGVENCRVRRISHQENPIEVLARILGDLGYKPLELIVGIDTGPRHAYVVIVDGKIIEEGYSQAVEDIIRIACHYTKLFQPKKSIVKIGSGAQSLQAPTSLEAAKCGIVVEYVDESRTTQQPPFIGNTSSRRKDHRASINIALR